MKRVFLAFRRLFRRGCAASAVALTACHMEKILTCETIVYAAVELSVVDGVTAQNLPSQAMVIVFHAGKTDTLSYAGEQRYSIGYNQSGDFDVTVKATGYAPWSKTFHAEDRYCTDRNMVRATAQLQRIP